MTGRAPLARAAATEFLILLSDVTGSLSRRAFLPDIWPQPQPPHLKAPKEPKKLKEPRTQPTSWAILPQPLTSPAHRAILLV